MGYIHSDNADFENELKGLLLYRKVVSVKEVDDQTAELILDNGVVLRTEGNEGCGGCGNGWYYLEALNRCDNAITNVECVDDEEKYNIFVYSENEKIKLLEYEGYDNGYYGTGYSVTVFLPDGRSS